MTHSLRTKILLLVIGTVVALSAIMFASLSFLAARDMERAAKSDVRATRAVLAQFLKERSSALTNQLTLSAQQPWLRGVIGTGDPKTVAFSLRENLGQLHADALVVTDLDGRVLDREPAQSRVALPTAGVRTALSGQICPQVVVQDHKLMLAVSVPVYVAGYICGSITGFSAIDQNLAQNIKESLGADVAFVDHGEVIAASRNVPSRVAAPTQAPAVVAVSGQRYFALYGPLPDTPAQAGIGFITMRSYESVMAPYENGRIAFAIIFVLTCLLGLAAGAGVARSITRPLGSVVEAAQILREGAWPARFTVARSDEIGLLQTVFNQMTESMRSNQEKLLALIDTDLLTGLDNHRRFQERMAQEVARCAPVGEPLSLLLIDLDHFHEFNQAHGHAAGDEALRQLAQSLLAALPDIAIVARYGGEEFAVLLPQHNLKQAQELAEAIKAGAFAGRLVDQSSSSLTVSVGCAQFGGHITRPEALVLAAELALSLAKQLGRNRVCRFDSVPGASESDDPYQMHRFLKDGSLATIQALAAAVDAKDPYTRGHSQSVAKYASALAKHMGLAKDVVDLIHTSGTLHDVGKIGVPDEILKKPGRLDEAERKIMETHPVLGEVIVRKAPQLAATLPAVRHHHERWDGEGYPDRLAGEAIPHIARILALADSFDAMTSDRPYRKGMPIEAALEEIEKGAGSQFDPDLAQAFLEMLTAQAESSLKAA